MAGFFRRLFAGSGPKSRVPAGANPRDAYTGLRTMALASKPADFGINDKPPTSRVYALLLEMGYPEATVTIFVGADGTASLYTSAGGGVIGGHSHAAVRAAVTQLLNVASSELSSLRVASTCPVPPNGMTVFYALTSGGVFTGKASTDALEAGKHALSRLFLAGQGVVTQLRLVAPNAGSA